MLSIILLLAGTTRAQNGFLAAGPLYFDVELHVYSGRESPHWPIYQRSPYFNDLVQQLDRTRPTRLPQRLGYRGFEIEMRNMFGQRISRTIGAGTNPRLELMLLRTSPRGISRSVRRNVMSTIQRRRTIMPNIVIEFEELSERPIRAPVCRLPRFNPRRWNVMPTIRQNNCYNYSTNRQTNTFAQPGRASGPRFSSLTARSVLRATYRDGLIPIPFFIPKRHPGVCLIALAIWPDTDYHFYRLDSNLLWSHKPGKTAAKNTDNSGNLIVDPKFADRGSYTIFAGYLGNHAGVRVI
ncbi:hypothetical protein ACF0H5_003027 [Mactra antiquata]